MTDRRTVDTINGDQLDQLYDDLDRYEEVVGELNEANTGLARDLARAEEECRRYTEAESADAAAGSYASGQATLTITVTAPNPVHAVRWAGHVRDLVHNEYGRSMGLHSFIELEPGARVEPDLTGPLTGIEIRDPCPWCESSPTLIPRQLMAGHVATVHPEVRDGGPGIPVPDAESAIVCTTACDEQHTYDWTCALFAGVAPEPEEARALADGLGTDLYKAQDALAFVEECCVIADREQRNITTADVRKWLKGAQCGRQLAADSGIAVDPAAPPPEFVTWTGPVIPRFTAHPVTPEMERTATERARQAAAESERSAAWFAATGGVIGGAGCSPGAEEIEPNDPAATDIETTARVFAALHRSAEDTVTRVIALYEQWVKAGPPPLGVSTARWWDRRLVELHGAIQPPAEQPRTTPDNPPTSENTPDNPVEEQVHAAIESELYEYRERTMWWPEEAGGVTKEIARLATRGAMEVLDGHATPAWTPPPPGSPAEQLPEHLLALIRDRLPDYTSTACQTADALACTATYGHPLYDQIREHAERLHSRCRLNMKFTGQLCVCGCGHPKEQP